MTRVFVFSSFVGMNILVGIPYYVVDIPLVVSDGRNRAACSKIYQSNIKILDGTPSERENIKILLCERGAVVEKIEYDRIIMKYLEV